MPPVQECALLGRKQDTSGTRQSWKAGAERCHGLNQLLRWHPANTASTPVCLPCATLPAWSLSHSIQGGSVFHWQVLWHFCTSCGHRIVLLSAPCTSVLCPKELLVTVPYKNCSPIWRWWHSLFQTKQTQLLPLSLEGLFPIYFVLEILQCICSLS